MITFIPFVLSKEKENWFKDSTISWKLAEIFMAECDSEKYYGVFMLFGLHFKHQNVTLIYIGTTTTSFINT